MENEFGVIKVSTTIGTSNLEDYNRTNPPYTCFFAESNKGNLSPILEFLSSNDTLLFVNILTYLVHLQNPNNPPLSHYLFPATSSLTIDGNYEYKYVLDSVMDGFYYAMEAFDVRDVKLIIATTEWPRSGGTNAMVPNAQTYNSNLVKHVRRGIPKWPRCLETYILSMYDENLKPRNAYDKSYGVLGRDENPLYTCP
ncbi:glucan endo-1,3-beta-glucosidase, acidic-like [Tasmannia lanceolata]|uniref:glucan endo-1,3-beta-glucosidase, acidic-like n=1 Tax=Tasmannia lanceolata TaxID=3420 RepID=UPI004064AAF7